MTMQPFVYTALPARVVFGSGTLALLGHELESLGCSRALVLSTPFQKPLADDIARQLDVQSVGVFAEAEMHTPIEVTERAVRQVASLRVDSVVSVGGGSTTGLGKAIALRTDLPQIVVPTTYAGSEATSILGETEAGRKTTQRNRKVLPEVIINDVDLTLTLPVPLSVTSGINAFAHAAEALYAADANPITSMLARQGMEAIVRGLPRIFITPDDVAARTDALFGAWACGVCLGSVDMALHHKLCHTLGGAFGLPHAETHTVLLPHTLSYNRKAAMDALSDIASALNVDDAPRGLFDLIESLKAPKSLQEIGMPHDGLDRASDLAASNPYPNPEPVTRAGIRALLERAFHGVLPA
jgi:alcohol dehydrogenase class IV